MQRQLPLKTVVDNVINACTRDSITSKQIIEGVRDRLGPNFNVGSVRALISRSPKLCRDETHQMDGQRTAVYKIRKPRHPQASTLKIRDRSPENKGTIRDRRLENKGKFYPRTPMKLVQNEPNKLTVTADEIVAAVVEFIHAGGMQRLNKKLEEISAEIANMKATVEELKEAVAGSRNFMSGSNN